LRRGKQGAARLRLCDLRLNAPEPERAERWLLVRRRVAEPSEVAYFGCGGPAKTSFEQLVAVAGKRWAVEECLEMAKGDCGSGEYEVRSWTG
jgi:SRSO17 transposase